MTSNKMTTNYWFTIEPYVYIKVTNNRILLYNTLDGATIYSDRLAVRELLQDILQVKNCGVILLTHARYMQRNIKNFIVELREKYMGDIIDTSLSKGKPVQLMPYYNFPQKQIIYKKHNFSKYKNVLENLSEITIHLSSITDVLKLSRFIQVIPGTPTFNIIGNIEDVENYTELMFCLNQLVSPKNILCSYKKVIALQPIFNNNFSYLISVCFPMDLHQWNYSRKVLKDQTLFVDYVFDVTSDSDYEQTKRIIEQFHIKNYKINPVYTGNNILFFEKNVFLTEEDILSTPISIKDIYTRQAINIYDFGKINIMPNGDAYGNLNYPKLGNIYNDSIYKIVQKEVDEGTSWLRVRNQAPCDDCIYQWLCPSPSNFELVINRSNLCHVKTL